MHRYMHRWIERDRNMYMYSGADLSGDATVLSERSGFVAMVGPAASDAPSLVGRGDASVLAPDSPSPSALACTVK